MGYALENQSVSLLGQCGFAQIGGMLEASQASGHPPAMRLGHGKDSAGGDGRHTFGGQLGMAMDKEFRPR